MTILDSQGLPMVLEEKVSYGTPESAAGGWYPIVREPFGGAWQRNIWEDRTSVLSYHAVYACMTLIAGDISKLGVNLIRRVGNVNEPIDHPNYSGVISKPNHYQTRNQFWENWILSKLISGNTFALKRRNLRGFVSALYILDPWRVRPLVSDQGDVFYEIWDDRLNNVNNTRITVPDREIIHDRMNCIFHPLCGVSPIFANALPALQGIRTLENSKQFFENHSNPGGILTAPGKISRDTVEHLKSQWDSNYTGLNQGKVAILGDGLKFERMAITAVDAQLIEQLKWSAEIVCSTYHVPPYMIGVGNAPSYGSNVQALNQQYYSQALQVLIEAAEICMNEGLSLPPDLGTQFDIDALLRMDTATKMSTVKDGISAGVLAPNEARAQFDLKPVKGGDTPYLQQQNFSLAALDERDKNMPPPTTPGTEPNNDDNSNKAAELSTLQKRIRNGVKGFHARLVA
jgi:HK97 family phage portal protein